MSPRTLQTAQVFRAGGRLLHLQSENALCRGDKDPWYIVSETNANLKLGLESRS
jgi:hypothetical protein